MCDDMQDFRDLPTIKVQDLTKPTWVCVRSEPHKEFFAEANLRRAAFEVYTQFAIQGFTRTS
jgi:hypothetical protein